MQQMLANIIFPAPSTAYLAGIFFPLAAIASLAVEIFVLRHFQKGLVSAERTVLTAICANTVSWWAGIAMSGLLPSGIAPTLVGDPERGLTMAGRGPDWNAIAVASFFLACAVSFVIEYVFLRLVSRWLPCRHPALCAAVANVSSYCVLGLLVAAHLYFDG
jgi:hypothetical protein